MGYMMKQALVLIITALLLTGCATTGEQNGRMGGALGGAAAGALLGDALDCQGCALIGAALGALAGGYVGGEIGRRMDEHDAAMANRAIDQNRSGQRSAWRNPDTGVSYDVTPVRTTYQQTGQPCREFVMGESTVGGQRQEVHGTACRQSDGSWKIQ